MASKQDRFAEKISMQRPDVDWLSLAIAERYNELLEVRVLIPMFNAFHNITKQPELADRAERRNLRKLEFLLPTNKLGFAGLIYKPPGFIHKFGNYYSLPGYLDLKVLPHFCSTTDELAKQRPLSDPSGFLAFVYMFFLLIHPLPDGNGRVARSILDYYNKKLNLNLADAWNTKEPKFSKDERHVKAFRVFFEKAGLPPRKQFCEDDPFPIPEKLRPHLDRMAWHMIEWTTSVKDRSERPGDRKQVKLMSELIGGPRKSI